MATIVRTEKRQRSAFGQLIKWAFIGFNVLMLVWLVSGMSSVVNMEANSDAARAGHAIGAAIGFSMILSIWVMGDLILGLFVLLTRGDKVIVEETPYGSSARGGFFNAGREPSSDFADPDAVVARYMQREQAASQGGRGVSTPPPSQGGFGRRR